MTNEGVFWDKFSAHWILKDNYLKNFMGFNHPFLIKLFTCAIQQSVKWKVCTRKITHTYSQWKKITEKAATHFSFFQQLYMNYFSHISQTIVSYFWSFASFYDLSVSLSSCSSSSLSDGFTDLSSDSSDVSLKIRDWGFTTADEEFLNCDFLNNTLR